MTELCAGAEIDVVKSLLFYLVMMSSLLADPVRLWSELAPGETVNAADQQKESNDGLKRISKVTVPTLQVFHADKEKATGAAVLVCPGGGYNILAIDHEGEELCRWLSKNGVTGVLLKYRVPRRKGQAKHLAPLQDAQRAMTMIRANAKQWGIHPQKVGVMGFSAGGHLAAVLLGDAKREYADEKQYRDVSAQPNFGILVYPAYIRKKKSPQELAPELNFTKDSPPVFITVAKTDRGYYPDSVLLASKLEKLKVPFQYHAFETGGHGFGMGTIRGGDEVKAWPEMCLKWMRGSGIITP